MRNSQVKVLAILLIAGLAAAQNWNYTNQNTGPWSVSSCTAGTQSPANFSTTSIGCSYFDNFQLSLNNIALATAWNTTLQNVQFTPFVPGESLGYLYVAGPGDTPINYTAQYILFHSPAENILSNKGQQPFEMQIYFNDPENATNVAAISILFTNATNQWMLTSPAYSQDLNSMPTATGISPTFVLSTLSARLLGNMNFLTYTGTTTTPPCSPVTWYVFGSTIYINQNIVVNAFNQLYNSANPNGASQSINVPGNVRINPTVLSNGVSRFCWTGYYKLSLPYNYGLWWSIVLTTLFFVFTISFDDAPIKDENYQTDPWTHHPIYSIYTVGNNIYTRKTRSSLLWINIINICIFTATFHAQIGVNGNYANIFLFGLYGCLCSIVATYAHGFFLRSYYIHKFRFVENDEERSEDAAQRMLFFFYIWVFIWSIAGSAIFIWQLSDLNVLLGNTPQNYWCASFFIAVLLDWLVFDPIACVLARNEMFLNIFKWKGYIYDAGVCHHTYKKQKKQD